jgi:hypothetical protein
LAEFDSIAGQAAADGDRFSTSGVILFCFIIDYRYIVYDIR